MVPGFSVFGLHLGSHSLPDILSLLINCVRRRVLPYAGGGGSGLEVRGVRDMEHSFVVPGSIGVATPGVVTRVVVGRSRSRGRSPGFLFFSLIPLSL